LSTLTKRDFYNFYQDEKLKEVIGEFYFKLIKTISNLMFHIRI